MAVAFVFWTIIGVFLAGLVTLLGCVWPGLQLRFATVCRWLFALFLCFSGMLVTLTFVDRVLFGLAGLDDERFAPMGIGYGLRMKDSSTLGTLEPERAGYPIVPDVEKLGMSEGFVMGLIAHPRDYFFLNAKSGSLEQFSDVDAFLAAVARQRVPVKLDPTKTAFHLYRGAKRDEIGTWSTAASWLVGLSGFTWFALRFRRKRAA